MSPRKKATPKPSEFAMPTVSLNGTSAKALYDQYMDVWQGIANVKKALRDAMPHGRDYEQHDTAAHLRLAQQQFLGDLASLDAVEEHMTALLMHVGIHT